MKSLLIIGALLMPMVLFSQEIMQNTSKVEKFSKSPGIIVKSTTIYDQRYYRFIILADQHVALVKYWDIAGKDTIYGIKIYGQVTTNLSVSPSVDLVRNYEVLMDPEELDNIISWLDLAMGRDKQGIVDGKEQISYVPRNTHLLMKCYKDIFELQYDYSDINTGFQMKASHMNDFYKALKEIKSFLVKK